MDGNDCGSILTTYTNLLIASTGFLSLIIIVTFVYSVIACCSASNAVYSTPSSIGATRQEIQMMPPQNPAYVENHQQSHQPTQGIVRGLGPVVYLTPPTFAGYAMAGSHQDNVMVSHALEPNNDDDEMRVSIGAESRL